MYLIRVLVRCKQDNVHKAPSVVFKETLACWAKTLGTQLLPVPPLGSTPRSSRILRTSGAFQMRQAGIYSDRRLRLQKSRNG